MARGLHRAPSRLEDLAGFTSEVWPGNFGLVQIAVAFPLVNYGVDYARGFAFGIGLQAIEASVGIGVGLLFLAREGLSYAMLKEMEGPAEPGEIEALEARSERT